MPDPNPTARKEVAVGLIVSDDGRLLLQHRDVTPGVSGAGLWGFFGGHIEPGEPPSHAFLREMQEELSWRPRHFEPYIRREVPSMAADRGYGANVVSHVFAAHLDVALDDLVLGEGQALALYALDALPDGIVPSLVSLITEFAASDAYKRVRRRQNIITATAILVDGEGKFLLQHRDDKDWIDSPGMWGSFGGRIEDYEPPDEGFLRELREELSWEPESFELFASVPYRRDPADERRQLIYLYAAPISVTMDALVLGEGQGMGFYSVDALPTKTQPDYAGLLRRFVATPMYDEMMRRARSGRSR